MKHLSTLLATTILALLITLPGCTKEEDILPEQLSPGSSECGSDGARLQADVQGSSYCASAQLLAVGGSGALVITGVDILGTTLILQMDSLTIGHHAITEADNSLLYMHLGTAFVPNGDPGVLEITALDTTARTIKATFAATLINEGNGSTRNINGSLDVGWTPE